MTRFIVVIALLTPITGGMSQQSSQPPVIQPRITELGTVVDSGGDDALLPQMMSLSPNGKFVAYSTERGLRLWNTATRSSTTLVAGSTGEIAWSRAGDAIVFQRRVDQGSQQFVWTLRLDPATGRALGGPQRVSLSPTHWPTPQFSPDGKSIAFTRADTPRRSSVVLVPSTGGSERVLASGFTVRRLRWSRDGSSVYYASRKDSLSDDYFVYHVPTNGGAARRAHDATGAVLPPIVMNDERLVFPGPNAIDHSQRPLKETSGRTLATLSLPQDSWADDGAGSYRMLAVREWRPRALRLLDLSTGSTRDLVDTTAEASFMTWSRDGSRIATIVRRGGAFSLVTFNTSGRELGNIRLVTTPRFSAWLDGRASSDLALSPDNRYAVYVSMPRNSLELVDMTTGDQRTLARSGITTTNPQWRPDSRSVRYVRDGAVFQPNDTRGIWEVSLDGTTKLVRALSFTEFPGAATILVNDTLVSSFGPRPPQDDHRLLALNGTPSRVMLPSGVVGGGRVSPDGRTLAIPLGSLSEFDKPIRQIALESINGGAVRMLDLPFTKVRFSAMHWHPDGKALYIPGRNTPSDPVTFYLVPIDGSAPRPVFQSDTREPDVMLEFSPDSRYVAFVVASKARATFLSADFTDAVSKLTGSSSRDQ